MSIQKDYKLIKFNSEEMHELIDKSISVEICDFNSASIFNLENGGLFLVGKVPDKYCILYNNSLVFEKHLENKTFPIPIGEDIVEKEKYCIEDIFNNINYYIELINNEFDFQYFPEESIENNIKRLEKTIKLKDLDNLSEHNLLAIGLYLNELFRIKTESIWMTKKIFTINPYWYPMIKAKNGNQYDLMGRVIKSFKEDKEFNLYLIFKSEMAIYSGYKPFSNEYLDYVYKEK